MSHHAIVEDRWEAACTAASALAWWCQLMHDCGSIVVVVVLHSTGHAPVQERRSVLVWGSTLHSPTRSHRLHEDSMRTLHESPWILGRLHSAFPIVHMDSLWSLHGLVDSMGTPQTVFHGLLMDSVRPPSGIHI